VFVDLTETAPFIDDKEGRPNAAASSVANLVVLLVDPRDLDMLDLSVMATESSVSLGLVWGFLRFIKFPNALRMGLTGTEAVDSFETTEVGFESFELAICKDCLVCIADTGGTTVVLTLPPLAIDILDAVSVDEGDVGVVGTMFGLLDFFRDINGIRIGLGVGSCATSTEPFLLKLDKVRVILTPPSRVIVDVVAEGLNQSPNRFLAEV
jgi:hypothetical protein